MAKCIRWVVFLAVLGALWAGGAAAAGPRDIQLPPRFNISIYAEVPGARSMAVAPELGVIFVGTRGSRLYAVRYRDGAGKAAGVETVADDLRVANGVAWHGGWLYVAEQHHVFRYRPRPGALGPRDIQVLYDRLPDKSHHGWRYAAFGPDGYLYVAVGAPCNICDVSGLEGTIVRMRPDGSGFQVFARGVRNSVGIDFEPTTGQAYFTDNGGDFMGDDSPPDELNRAAAPGGHFGYPHYAGGRDVSFAYRGRRPPPGAIFPVLEFGAHVAALGIHFYRGGMFPAEYRGDAFVAQHGSWNRSVPDGYRIMRVRFDSAGRARKEIFARGWLQGGSAWGRPVDVKTLPDGSLMVSDDRAGLIYRITYGRR